MCEHAEFNTGTVAITTQNREELKHNFGLSTNTISKYLKSLKELNLISGDKGTYKINPKIF